MHKQEATTDKGTLVDDHVLLELQRLRHRLNFLIAYIIILSGVAGFALVVLASGADIGEIISGAAASIGILAVIIGIGVALGFLPPLRGQKPEKPDDVDRA